MGTNGKLTPADLAMFARLRIPAELIIQVQIERLTDREARERLAINGRAGDMSGIYFPYLNPRGGSHWTCRVRRDNPEVENGKPKNKYMSAFGNRKQGGGVRYDLDDLIAFLEQRRVGPRQTRRRDQ